LRGFFEDRKVATSPRGGESTAFLAAALVFLAVGVGGRYLLARLQVLDERILARTVEPLGQLALWGLEAGSGRPRLDTLRLDSLERAYARTYIDADDSIRFLRLRRSRATVPGERGRDAAFRSAVGKNVEGARAMLEENRRETERSGWLFLLVACAGAAACLGLAWNHRRMEAGRREREAALRKADEERRRSEKRFHDLVETASVAIRITFQGRNIYANRACMDLFGYRDLESFRRVPVRETYAPVSRDLIDSVIRAATERREQPIPYEATCLRADGSEFRARISTSSIELEEGPAAVGFIVDTTVEMAAQEKLLRSDARFRQLVENSPTAIRISVQGRMLYANPACVDLFGYPDMDSLGEVPVAGTFVGKWRELAQATTRATSAEGAILRRTEGRAVRRDGTEFDVRVSNFGIQLEEGFAIVGFLQDTTAENEALEKLVRSEARFRSLIEDPSLAIRISRQGRILYANRACLDLFGYDREEEFLAISIDETYAPSDRDLVQDWTVSIENGASRGSANQVVCRRRDGTEFFSQAFAAKVNLEDGEAIVGFHFDVTESVKMRMRAEEQREQLIHADRMSSLGVLTAGVAHEVNNPNNLVRFNADLLEKILSEMEPVLDAHAAADPAWELAGIPYAEMKPEIRALLAGMRDGSDRIRDIVDGLKDFARRPAVGSMRAGVDPAAVARSAARLVSSLVRRSTDRWEEDLPEGLPRVRGDSQQLEQVVVNLLTNACQALPGRDRPLRLSVQTDSDRSWVEIEVEDGGTGIPPENLPKILDPFFTTKREKGGTGLGLSVSWGIVQAHGGQLAFHSREGGGTRVVLRLPAAEGVA
jgi:PAS domain S-box-containing protein